MELKDRIIVALDVDSLSRATPLIQMLSPYVGYFKVGLELVTSQGAPAVVQHIHHLGGRIFFDTKFNDIPSTMARASRAVAALGVEMFDVHASAGLEAVKSAITGRGKSKCLVVTVLTSLNDENSTEIFGSDCKTKVIDFAHIAFKAHAHGIVCSPDDLTLLEPFEDLKNLLKVTPGIRPSWAATDDHKRALTPAEAIKHGASHLVIGRPITCPPAGIGTPVEAAKKILEEIAGALR